MTTDEAATLAPRVSSLPQGITLRGDVRGDEDLVVFGTVEGDVTLGGMLIVEEGGRVTGNVVAATVTVRGAISGTVRATVSIQIAPRAAVLGDLFAPAVSISKCATVLGALQAPGPGRAPAGPQEDATVTRSRPGTAAATAAAPSTAGRPRPPWLLIQRRRASLRGLITQGPAPVAVLSAADRPLSVRGAEGRVLPPPSPEFPQLKRVVVRRRDHVLRDEDVWSTGVE